MLLELIFNVLLQNIPDTHTHNITSPWAPVGAKKATNNLTEYYNPNITSVKAWRNVDYTGRRRHLFLQPTLYRWGVIRSGQEEGGRIMDRNKTSSQLCECTFHDMNKVTSSVKSLVSCSVLLQNILKYHGISECYEKLCNIKFRNDGWACNGNTKPPVCPP